MDVTPNLGDERDLWPLFTKLESSPLDEEDALGIRAVGWLEGVVAGVTSIHGSADIKFELVDIDIMFHGTSSAHPFGLRPISELIAVFLYKLSSMIFVVGHAPYPDAKSLRPSDGLIACNANPHRVSVWLCALAAHGQFAGSLQ